MGDGFEDGESGWIVMGGSCLSWTLMIVETAEP
jgi:hypothetical protein